MLTLIGLASIGLMAMYAGGLYILYQQSYGVENYQSRELDHIASEARRAELRAQEMGRLARAQISNIISQSRH